MKQPWINESIKVCVTPSYEDPVWERIIITALNQALALGRMTLDPDTPVNKSPFAFEVGSQPALGRVGLVSYGEYDGEVGDDVEIVVGVLDEKKSMACSAYYRLTRTTAAICLNWVDPENGQPSWFKHWLAPDAPEKSEKLKVVQPA